MNKKLNVIFIATVLAISLITSVFVFAKPDNANKPDLSFLPPHATKITEDVFSLGTSVDKGTGKVVEGFLFIHNNNKRENAKPPWAGGGNGGSGGTSTCYSFMAKGAKWKSSEDYIINASNNVGLNESFVKADIASDIAKWESASGKNIFGNEIPDIVDGDDSSSPDNKNEVLFKNLGPTNTIAYTIVWGIFGGKPNNRELIEWDMVFNEDFSWSSAGNTSSMDFENIATHELGHAAGLSHPESTCTEETMYAYADLGETKKRYLNPGDIEGITNLYK